MNTLSPTCLNYSAIVFDTAKCLACKMAPCPDDYQNKKVAAARQPGVKIQLVCRVDLKELKMRPSTDVNDYNVRLRKAALEIGKSNHVKVVITFKGREFNFKDKGREMLERFLADLGDTVQVERKIRMEGRCMNMILSPKR